MSFRFLLSPPQLPRPAADQVCDSCERFHHHSLRPAARLTDSRFVHQRPHFPRSTGSGAMAQRADRTANAGGRRNIREQITATMKRNPRCGPRDHRSWIRQVTDDEGTIADRFNGFSRARLWCRARIITFSKENRQTSHPRPQCWGWIHEFENEKRVEGDLFSFSASFKF